MSETAVSPGPPLPEDRFTQPTERCPHPECWTSTDSESSEVEVGELLYGLVRGLQPRAVLETGTAFGITAERIARALAVNGHGQLYTLEADPERYAAAAARLLPYAVAQALTRTLDWTPPDGVLFDLVYLDAYYRDRVAEFNRFRPWMRVGTIVALHDTAPGHGEDDADLMTTVARGLRGRARLIHLPTPRGLTLAEVLRDPR